MDQQQGFVYYMGNGVPDILQQAMMAQNIGPIEQLKPVAIVSPRVSTRDMSALPQVIPPQMQVASLSISDCGRYQVVRVKPQLRQASGHQTAEQAAHLGVITEDGQIATLLPITSIDKELPSLLVLHRQMLQQMQEHQPAGEPITSAFNPQQESAQDIQQVFAPDNLQQKCRDFLQKTIELADESVKRFVQMLTQNLIDNRMPAHKYCIFIKHILDTDLHPHMEDLLEEVLPPMRQSMVFKSLVIEGINPPPYQVAFPQVAPPEYEYIPPIAVVPPLQPMPMSNISYNMQMPLATIAGPLAKSLMFCEMIDTDPQPGDLHLFSPYVGYIHVRQPPKQETTDSFQIGDTTIKLVKDANKNKQWPPYDPASAEKCFSWPLLLSQ